MGIRPCPRHEATAHGQGRAVHRIHAQQMKADARSRDIHDGIDGAYVMEVDLVHRGPVHAGLGLGQPREDARRAGDHRRRMLVPPRIAVPVPHLRWSWWLRIEDDVDLGRPEDSLLTSRRSRVKPGSPSLASSARSASKGTPASTKAPMTMSPAAPLGQSK